MSKNKKMHKRRPWKKHKQVLVSLRCGVRTEVDKNIAFLIEMLNNHNIETRHSCEGRKPHNRGYISMFATPQAVAMGHYLLERGSKIQLVIERDVHPFGYENLTIRWPKKHQKGLEDLLHEFFYGKY